MAIQISENLQALVNDVLYHYPDPTATHNWGQIQKYAIVLRDWTGRFVASGQTGQPDFKYAGGPAVVFCSAAAAGDFDDAQLDLSVFYDKIIGTNDAAGAEASATLINAGRYVTNSGNLPAGQTIYTDVDVNGVATYGNFVLVSNALTLLKQDEDDGSFSELTTDATQSVSSGTDKWGLTYGFTQTSIGHGINGTNEEHFGHPQKWEFWFKTAGNSPIGDVFVENHRLGQGPIFDKWMNSGCPGANGFWLGAYGDVTKKDDVWPGTDDSSGTAYADTKQMLEAHSTGSSFDFVFIPDLSIPHGDDGYEEASMDANDKIDELYYRIEVSDTVSGTSIDSNSYWVDKPVASALASSSGNADYKKFVPNRIIFYKNQADNTTLTLAELLTLRKDCSDIALIGASGVYDLGGGSGYSTSWDPLDSSGVGVSSTVRATSANLPFFIPQVSGINLRTSPLNIQNHEFPITIVLERIVREDGSYIPAQEMYTYFDSYSSTNMEKVINPLTGEYKDGSDPSDSNVTISGTNAELNSRGLQADRLIYHIESSIFDGGEFESTTKVNFHLQWGKKPITNAANGVKLYPAQDSASNNLTTANTYFVEYSNLPTFPAD